MKATSEAESPKSFIYWSALTAISAVVRKNVCLDKFYYKLYPNIYTMLRADSGGRKGFPVWLAEELVRQVDCTRIISGRNSIQSIILALSKTQTKEGGVQNFTDARGFIVSGEFHELIIEDDSALTILTSLYDTHSRKLWQNTLKGSGTETLKDVCITLLGASNDALLKKAIPEHAIEGGFIGRMLVIPDDGSGPINPLTRKPKNEFDVGKLVPYLKLISELKGEFHYTEASMALYEDWYDKHRKRKVKDRTGTYNRLHDQILKVSMLLSLARGTDLMITEKDLDQAIDSCQSFTVNTKFMGEGQGKATLGPGIKTVFAELLAAPENQIPRQQLLREHYGEFDHIDLSRIEEHMVESDWIVVDVINGRKVYRMKQWVVEHAKKL